MVKTRVPRKTSRNLGLLAGYTAFACVVLIYVAFAYYCLPVNTGIHPYNIFDVDKSKLPEYILNRFILRKDINYTEYVKEEKESYQIYYLIDSDEIVDSGDISESEFYRKQT